MFEYENHVRAVQYKINELLGESYYQTYSAQEMEYWRHCAKWLYDDALENQYYDCHPLHTKVLDVGCGYGTLSALASKEYPSVEVYPVDIRRLLNPIVEEDFRMKQFIQADIETDELPFPREKLDFPKGMLEKDKNYVYGKFDVIIFTEVMEHLFFNPLPTLRKLKDYMRYDGFMILSTPDAAEWGRVTDMYDCIQDMPMPGDVEKPEFNSIDRHIYQYSEGEVIGLLKEAGLKIMDFQYSIKPQGGRHLNFLLGK